jgi:hypothetical protein
LLSGKISESVDASFDLVLVGISEAGFFACFSFFKASASPERKLMMGAGAVDLVAKLRKGGGEDLAGDAMGGAAKDERAAFEVPLGSECIERDDTRRDAGDFAEEIAAGEGGTGPASGAAAAGGGTGSASGAAAAEGGSGSASGAAAAR